MDAAQRRKRKAGSPIKGKKGRLRPPPSPVKLKNDSNFVSLLVGTKPFDSNHCFGVGVRTRGHLGGGKKLKVSLIPPTEGEKVQAANFFLHERLYRLALEIKTVRGAT